MSDTPAMRDFDEMSDEEFMKLSEEDAMQAVESQTPRDTSSEESDDEGTELDEETGTSDSADVSDESDESDTPSDPGAESAEDDEEEDETPKDSDPHSGDATPVQGEEKPGGKPGADTKEKGKKPAAGESDAETGDLSPADIATAVQWHKALTAPFKADGRDFQVRSVEDAVRLMQQGVNYSRRMEELKPAKRLARVLADHQLNDPAKLNFLIDLSKGSKEAVVQLLKQHNIDPMDLDSTTETPYQAPSYGGNPSQDDFRDELDQTIANPEGQALVTHIHETWDEQSKRMLRQNPGTLGKLTDMKRDGVYDKIVGELNYQRAMGYLTNVPFLNAFDQVGKAMEAAGVLYDQPQQEGQMGTLGTNPNNAPRQSPAPVATGARKAPPPKREQPNPHLSSTPPTKQTNTGSGQEVDFDKMSDEEFAKLSPPD